MESIRATWNAMLGNRISTTRMGGYSLLWLWTVMMFNSIVPYSFAAEPRAPLYVELTLSLVTMVVTMLFVAVALGRTDRLSDNRFILWGAAGAMALGSILAAFGETDSSVGMGALVFSSVLTGSGSAALFVCWGERFFGIGGRVALVELAVGSCVAFILGFFLCILPAPAALAIIAATPLGSAWLLLRDQRRETAQNPTATMLPEREPLSRSTVGLLVKTLAGSLLEA